MFITPLENEKYDEYIKRILFLRPNVKINKGQQRHHIIPKSRGGSNDKDNLIWLYACEHAVAHYLYSKEHPHDSGMAYAGHVLTHKDGRLLSMEQIQEIALLNSKCQSERVSGSGNPMWGKKQTEESKEKNRQKQIGKSAGEKNYFYGKSFAGENHPRYGKEVSLQQRQKQSEAMKGKMVGGRNPKARKIRCINTGEIFTTIKEANLWLHKPENNSDIQKSLRKQKTNGRQYSSGKHPVTGEKLYWEYVENSTRG